MIKDTNLRIHCTEKWITYNETTHASSIIEYCFKIIEPLEELYNKLGHKNFKIWSDYIEQFLDQCVRIYCTSIEELVEVKKQFIPRPLPSIDNSSRSKIINRKTSST